MTKPHEKGCADCERGWTTDDDGDTWRPCHRCRPDDHARWAEQFAGVDADQLTLRPPPPERDRFESRADLR